jgi:hypothetical protein
MIKGHGAPQLDVSVTTGSRASNLRMRGCCGGQVVHQVCGLEIGNMNLLQQSLAYKPYKNTRLYEPTLTLTYSDA